ncbi:stonin-2 [Callorhinchus milii]|uniref:stonin-2 n=1 Tax=Callorhinchus milii TaxID=7868 RepID=UPI001C3F9A86|nr:stonin-2 [Callorhinchus milii]
MEALTRQPDPTQLNGCAMSATGFSNWVTFDDDSDFVTSVKPPPSNSHTAQGKGSSVFGSKAGSKNNLVDFATEDRNEVFSPGIPDVFLTSPARATNPFLDESLRDIQPSTINPFQAFFDQNESNTKKLSETGSTLSFRQQKPSGSLFSGVDDVPPFSQSPDPVFSFPSPHTNGRRDCDMLFSHSPISPFSGVNTNDPRDSVMSFSPEPSPQLFDGNASNQSDSVTSRNSLDLNILFSASHSNGQTLSAAFSQSVNPTFTDDSEALVCHQDAITQLKHIQIVDPDHCDSPTLPDDPLHSPDTEDFTFDFVQPQPKDGWPLMLRIPERKNIMSSRHWGPIYVKLLDSARIQLFYEKGLEKSFKQLQLLPCHELSEVKLQNYDENGKVHTVSIDQVLYKEKRKYHAMATVQAPVRIQLLKFGTTCYQDCVSFVTAIQDTLFKLPASRDIGATYSEEEVTVVVQDEFKGTVAREDNSLFRHSVTTRISVLAFVSGMPECRMGLNDVVLKGNEVVARHDIIPTTTTKWIKMSDCQFHQCGDANAFKASRVIKFVPLEGHKFELMRFRARFGERSLPFTLKTIATVQGAEIELQSWLVMSSGFVSNQQSFAPNPCENVMIRFPVPPDWVKNFRREGVLREKSLKARVNRSASFGSASVSGSEPVMRVTLGSAKYEHAFKAIVWRINRLPDKNSASGHPHSFYCHLELGSDREVPSIFVHYVDVEFDMPSTSASKTAVRSISVANRTDVRKWVIYKAHYSYQVEMEQKRAEVEALDGTDKHCPTECVQQ